MAGRDFSAPARVNLIGEHTDYTGGLVLPMAISFATTASVTPASDGLYTFASTISRKTRSITPQDRSSKVGNWSDYPVGVLRELQALHIHPPPFHLHLRGNVPLGSGLSSSASVEVAAAMALLAHSGATLPGPEIATLCRRAENSYVHSPCGIMDQFVIANATAGHALLLDTRDLSFELLPMNTGALAGCLILIANSGVRHSVATGDYGLRRREVEAGQNVLRERYPHIVELRDATLGELDACKDAMPIESYLRCRHIITENTRVREAAQAMVAGDPTRLGEIMVHAHASFRDDFACSIPEIDFLVDTALAQPGCYGARLTGGGFGGCTVNLVRAANAEAFSVALAAAYNQRYGIVAEIYSSEAVDGAVARLASHTATETRA